MWSGLERVMCVCILLSAFAHAASAPPNERRDELIRQYFSQGYTWKQICGFLLYLHNIVVSLSQMKRIMKRLKLRRHNVSSPLPDILHAVLQARIRGYENAGYKTLWRVINSTTNVNATQETIRQILKTIDPEGVSQRSRHRLRRRMYTNRGPNYLVHVDGYDKLKPFGIAIHGAIDGFSRKLLWLQASYSNNNPKIVARYFIDYVKNMGRVPRVVRGDGGTENTVIRDLQVAFRFKHIDRMSAVNSYLCGRSTSNQRIERFWATLKHHFTVFWRNHFTDMSDAGILRIDDPVHKECLRYCFLPIIQHDLNDFLCLWNRHRIRRQRHAETPSGIPDVLYHQPELHYARDYSFPLPCNLATLDRVRELYTSPTPPYSCSEPFMQVVEEITGIDRVNLSRPCSVETATQLFTTLIEIINSL